MRRREHFKSREGFTLVEILIFIAIFTLIVGAFIAILVSVINIQSQQVGINENETQGQYVEQQLSYYIQSARLIGTTADTATSTLLLYETNPAINPTLITFASGTIYVQNSQTGFVASPLTSNKVTVSNGSFTHHYNLNSSSSVMGTDSVSYSFTLNSGSGADESTSTFRSSVSISTPVPKIELVQYSHQENNTGPAGSSSWFLSLSSVQEGDLLITVAVSQDEPVSSISDSNGNTWTALKQMSNSSGYLSVYYAKATSTVSNDSVNVNFTNGSAYEAAFVYQYRGAPLTSSTTVSSASSTQYTTTPSSGLINPSSGPELLFGIDYGENIIQTPSSGSGYALESSSTVNYTTQVFAEDSVQYVSNPVSAGWTYSSAVSSTVVLFAFP